MWYDAGMGKKADITKEERFQRIHALLNRQQPVSCDSLAEKLGVSTKTIQRDLEEMNGKIGGKIRWNSREGSYRYTQPVSLWNQTFIVGEDEVTALLLACSMMKDFSSVPLSDEMDRLSRTLMSGKYNPFAFDRPNPSKYSFVHTRMARVDPKIWKICIGALNGCRKLDLVYQKLGCKPVKRRIVPLHLRGTKGGWYLVSHCESAEGQRTFNMSRIREAEDTGEQFSPANYHFDPDQYFRKRTDIFKAGANHSCEVRLTDWAVERVKEMTFFDGQKLVPQPDGSAILRFETEDLFSAAEFVMIMAGNARALKPVKLVKKVKENIRALAKAHRIK
jgi:predicted DNA-binding transcriptional regulator YafY